MLFRSTYAKYYGITLSDANNLQFYIPEGFAHGFVVLSEVAIFAYKCTDFYHPNDEGGLSWDDPDINIDWPLIEIGGVGAVLLSNKDKVNPTLREIEASNF